MTDLSFLTKRLFNKIEWQHVPHDVTIETISGYIAEGIRELYNVTGRSVSFSEDWFVIENGVYRQFEKDLAEDENQYVLATAELEFYRKVQTDVDTLTSYTTDAMSVSHGDKPFANLQQKIDGLVSKQNKAFYKLTRFIM